MIKFKVFIYRLSNVFGLHIYLAKKEEQKYIDSLCDQDEFNRNISIGCWQAQQGFTTVWTYKQPWYKAFCIKLKHAFNFRSYR